MLQAKAIHVARSAGGFTLVFLLFLAVCNATPSKSQEEQEASNTEEHHLGNAQHIAEAGFWTPLLMSIIAGGATSLGAGVVYLLVILY
jgi:hypothetical protein